MCSIRDKNSSFVTNVLIVTGGCRVIFTGRANASGDSELKSAPTPGSSEIFIAPLLADRNVPEHWVTRRAAILVDPGRLALPCRCTEQPSLESDPPLIAESASGRI